MAASIMSFSTGLAFAGNSLISTFGLTASKNLIYSAIKDDAGNPLSIGLEKQCLTLALYHEARGEPVMGQIAVGKTILNRVRSKVYPNTICGVVFQNAHKTNKCQFSFACDGRSDKMTKQEIAQKLHKISKALILSFRKKQRQTDFFDQQAPYMTHYHRYDVHPSWSNNLEILAHIGNHVFFRSERVVRSYRNDPMQNGIIKTVMADLKLPQINASNEIGL